MEHPGTPGPTVSDPAQSDQAHRNQAHRNQAERIQSQGSPVLAFVQERCVTEPIARVGKAELYAAYVAYCDEHDVEDRTSEVFARELYKAVPVAPKNIAASAWSIQVQRNW